MALEPIRFFHLSVEDIVDAADVRVWRAPLVGELHAPKAFLFTTARNLTLDDLHRHSVSRPGA